MRALLLGACLMGGRGSDDVAQYIKAHSIVFDASTRHRTLAHTAYKRGVTFSQASAKDAASGHAQSSAHNLGEAIKNLETAVGPTMLKPVTTDELAYCGRWA